MAVGYKQVAADLRADFDAGSYPPGSRLPSESELARAYGVARGTVRQALATLASEGLVSTRKGARRLVLGQQRLQGFNELRSFSEWAHAMGEQPGGRVVALVRREATSVVLRREPGQVGQDADPVASPEWAPRSR